MKLRILGDSLRLRLSQSDVRALIDEGQVESAVHFGPGQVLRYVLRLDPGAAELQSVYADDAIVVRVPAERGRAWARGDEVGMAGEQRVADGRELSLLVEKDFKCLTPREGEEAYDGFPNPGGAGGC